MGYNKSITDFDFLSHRTCSDVVPSGRAELNQWKADCKNGLCDLLHIAPADCPITNIWVRKGN